MRGIRIGIQSILAFLSTVAVVFAEETKKAEGAGSYDAMAGVWYSLIAIIVAYGIYDSFFKPVE